MEKVPESDFNFLLFYGMRFTGLRDTSGHGAFLIGITEKNKNVINLNKINSKNDSNGKTEWGRVSTIRWMKKEDMVFINIQVPLRVIKTVLLRGAWYKWTKY